MKKTIFISMLLTIVSFIACSDDNEFTTSEVKPGPEKSVVFNLSIDDLTSVKGDITDAIPSRYVVEIWDGSTLKHRKESSDANFSFVLNENVKYSCLFWADYDNGEIYDVDALKAVSIINDEVSQTKAYFASDIITVTAEIGTQSIKLKRAVAEILLIESGNMTNNSIRISYDRYTQFNVLNGIVDDKKSFSGSVDNRDVENKQLGSFLTFAPNTADGITTDFTLKCDGKANKVISNVKIKANVVTSVEENFFDPTPITTFNLSIDPVIKPTISRYIMEIWLGGALITHKESTTPKFEIDLKKDREYTCLFWADVDGENGSAFNTDQLKSVMLINDVAVTDAYYANSIITVAANESHPISLKRTVAEVKLFESGEMKNNQNTVAYSRLTKFDTSTGVASEAKAYTNEFEGKDEEKKQLGSLLTLATDSEEGSPTTFTFTFTNGDNKQENIRSNVKLKANSTTSLTTWIIGDFYLHDDNRIGIVCQINENGDSGSIMQLPEKAMAWSTLHTVVGANNTTDGRENHTIVKSLVGTTYTGNTNGSSETGTYALTDFPAFKYCEDRTEGNGDWYLPAIDELSAMAETKVAQILQDIMTENGYVRFFNDYYYSSTEHSQGVAKARWPHGVKIIERSKNKALVRCVKRVEF